MLTDSGLQRVSDVHFKLSPDAPEKTITEWISTYREMLQQSFLLTGNMGNTPYCLDEIRIEQSCDDEPDWFELHITVVIGNLRIPFSRFRKHILEEKREFLLPDGRMILLPEEWFSKYGNLLELGTQTETGIRLKPTFVGAVQSALEENGPKNLLFKREIRNVPVPQGLNAKLRPYQQKGFSWMVQLNKQGFGGCLADDMGLGKTLQTLTLLQYIYKPLSPDAVTAPMKPVFTETTASDSQPDKECTANNPPVREQIADAEGQFSLFSFSSEDELLPDAREIREKNRPKEDDHRQEHGKNSVSLPL